MPSRNYGQSPSQTVTVALTVSAPPRRHFPQAAAGAAASATCEPRHLYGVPCLHFARTTSAHDCGTTRRTSLLCCDVRTHAGTRVKRTCAGFSSRSPHTHTRVTRGLAVATKKEALCYTKSNQCRRTSGASMCAHACFGCCAPVDMTASPCAFARALLQQPAEDGAGSLSKKRSMSNLLYVSPASPSHRQPPHRDALCATPRTATRYQAQGASHPACAPSAEP